MSRNSGQLPLTTSLATDIQATVHTGHRGSAMVKRVSKEIAVFLTLLALAGCPSIWQTGTSVDNAPPEEMYRNAQNFFEKKDYTQAAEVLERLKSAHPDFSKKAEVHLKIADAFFNDRSFDKAISRYSQFVELFPTHKEVPRAKYQIALSYFEQIKPTDRDSAALQAATNAFKGLVDDPKAAEWAKKAEEKLQECRKMLASKEWYKAGVYEGNGQYKAARMAAQRVLDEYPKLGFDAQANELIKRLKDK